MRRKERKITKEQITIIKGGYALSPAAAMVALGVGVKTEVASDYT